MSLGIIVCTATELPACKPSEVNVGRALAVWILILTPAVVAWTQPDTLWTRTYGARDYDYSYAVQQTADSGFVIVGSQSAPSHSVLLRTNAAGNQRWIDSLGVSTSCANDVQPTVGGGFLLAGNTSTDAILIKTDSAGGQQWSHSLSQSHASFLSLVKSTNGNYIAAGTESDSVRSTALYAKVDSAGNTVWLRRYTGPSSPRLSLTIAAICATSDGGFAAAGTLDTVDGLINEDFSVIRVSSAGDTLWTRRIGGPNREFARSIQNTGDGFVMAGHDFLGSAFYPHILKFDGNGNVLWNRVITTVGNGTCAAAYEIENGDLIIAGTLIDGVAGVPEFFLARVAPNDTVLWEQHYGGSGAEWAEDMKLTSDGGCIITGRTNSFDSQQWDFYVVRVGPFHTATSAQPRILLPVALNLSAYPNPFNANTRIQFALPTAEKVKLVVYDVLGRNVLVLANGVMESGTHSLIFDGSSFASGSYFARLEAGNSVRTEKMLLLK